MGEVVSIRAAVTPTYEDYYGFAQSPFSLAPDPHFLYLSQSHEDAIRQLLDAVRRHEGVIVLTGEVGTGKTTLGRALLSKLDRTSFASLILNPFLSVDELLREILLDFGILSREDIRSGRAAAASRHELTSTLHEFLLSLHPIGGRGVLIIDEAQHLTADVLEHIRVIATVDTNTTRLLQVILIGQPSLLESLDRAEMRQLQSRVSVRASLRPLGREDVEAYVFHRLSVAGGPQAVRFDAEGLDALLALTGGVPRLINLVCDRALMTGAQAATHDIGADLVRQAGRVLGMAPPGAPPAPVARRRGTAAFVIAAVAVAAAAFAAAFMPLSSLVTTPPPEAPAPPALGRAPALEPLPLPPPGEYPPEPPPRPVVSPTF